MKARSHTFLLVFSFSSVQATTAKSDLLHLPLLSPCFWSYYLSTDEKPTLQESSDHVFLCLVLLKTLC